MSKLAVVAIGGNSLILDDKHVTVADQFEAMRQTATHLADMIVAGWQLVITHGNGPQVGFIFLRAQLARNVLHGVPLDSCGADTQGAIGYMIQQCLHNEFGKRGMSQQAISVVTQVVVDPADPRFQAPSKPIGPFYPEAEARKYAESDGWDIMEDAGRGWRRVVASPLPQEIVEIAAIRALIESGQVVIAVGGGGIPVVRDESGILRGVEAVIDKDLASSLLATQLGADLLLISTGVEKAYLNFRKPDQQALDRLTAAEARSYLAAGHFARGSMAPKIDAAAGFIERGGPVALITDPPHISAALRGETGTWIISSTAN